MAVGVSQAVGSERELPEPATILLATAALLLALALVSLSRFMRLRRHIDESASAVAAERHRRDRLVRSLRQAGSSDSPFDETGGSATGDARDPRDLSEQVEEAEDRLAAVNRLYTAQVRAWNRLGRVSPWGRLRGLTGWQPIPESPAEESRRAPVKDDEPA